MNAGNHQTNYISYLPTVMSMLSVCDSLLWTKSTPEPGSTMAIQMHVLEEVARSEGVYNTIWYTLDWTELESTGLDWTGLSTVFTMALILPVGPRSIPVTTTSLSTASSSWMVQVKVRSSPSRRVVLASGSRLKVSVGGGTVYSQVMYMH